MDALIDRLNKFLDNHTFSVATHYGPTNIKLKITGKKNYINVGESKPYLQYTLYIMPSDEYAEKVYGLFFNNLGDKIDITTKSFLFVDLRNDLDKRLKSLIEFFGIDYGVICTKVVNGMDGV